MDPYLLAGNYVACPAARCRMAAAHTGPHLPARWADGREPLKDWPGRADH